MKLLVISLSLVCSIVFTSNGYDKELAKTFNTFFESFTDKEVGKALQKLCVKDFIKRNKLGEEFFILDIRTVAETKLIGVTLPNTLTAPMDKVFLEENLKKLPTDKNIVVVCAKGSRATATAMALRQIGFKKVYILSGGFAKLASTLCPTCVK